MPKTTTLQIDRSLKARLDRLKIHPRETYNDVIERLVEDTKELSPAILRSIEKARADFKAGRYQTHAQVKRELGL